MTAPVQINIQDGDIQTFIEKIQEIIPKPAENDLAAIRRRVQRTGEAVMNDISAMLKLAHSTIYNRMYSEKCQWEFQDRSGYRYYRPANFIRYKKHRDKKQIIFLPMQDIHWRLQCGLQSQEEKRRDTEYRNLLVSVDEDLAASKRHSSKISEWAKEQSRQGSFNGNEFRELFAEGEVYQTKIDAGIKKLLLFDNQEN